MAAAMNGSGAILPRLGPAVPILPLQQSPHLASASASCITAQASHFQPSRRVPQHSSHAMRHQQQRVLLLDKQLQNGSFCVKQFTSSFHGDARALKEQSAWPEEKLEDAINLYPSRESKITVDVQSFNREFDESHPPPGNYPSLVSQLPNALEPHFPSASLDQSKTLDSPVTLDQSTSSTLEVVQPGSVVSSKPLPTISTSSEHRRPRPAVKSTRDQRAPWQNKERPGPRLEKSNMPAKKFLPRSPNRIDSSNENRNSSKHIDAGVESKNVISNQRLWRNPDGGSHSTAQDRWQSRASNGNRDRSRDIAQGNGSTHMRSAGTTSEAIAVLKNRLQRGINTDSSVYIKVLQMCLQEKNLLAAKQVHDCIIESGMDKNPYVTGTLLNVYIKCGRLLDSRRVFDALEKKTVITWNLMIAGYVQIDRPVSAFELFKLMRQEDSRPDKVTYLSILKACANPSAVQWGEEVHECIRHAGLESDRRIGTALLKMYAKCGCITEARRVFDSLTNRDLITWNTMIGAYAEHDRGVEAYRLFVEMGQEGFEPDAFTYASILKAFSSAGDLECVKEVHARATKAGLESHLRVGNALVHTYAGSGSIDHARLVFDRMAERDVVTWNTMIGGLAQQGCGQEAYRLFLQMRREGFKPNTITYLSVLNASASAGALEWVKDVHLHARKARLESDLRVGAALIHMYAESGSIDDARLVFDRMEKRDVVTWNIMLGGLANHGCAREAQALFRKMNSELVKPDGTTFVAVFSACCHGGLLDEGRRLFSAMKQDYGIEPTIVHYNCMVDLLGRAGHLEDARFFISDMPIEPDVVTWKALLGACRTYGNVELGEFAAKEVFKLEPNDESGFVLLSNIYAAAGKWEKVALVRTMMQKRGVQKEPGRSWIEVDTKIHEFVAGDISHPETNAIYTELNKLTEKLKAEGYIPDTRLVLHDINEEDKELALCSHSEKLAISYGLMHVPLGEPIRVRKNLRVCPDCHTATKLISKVTGREIIARDANRFHHFKEGVCSCGDFW